MSELIAMVDLNATRTIAQADPVEPLSLEGVQVIELSISASDAATREGLDLVALRMQFDSAMRALGVTVNNGPDIGEPGAGITPRSASIAIRIEVMESTSPALTAHMKLQADRFKSMRAVRPMRHMEAHESYITWQGLELGANIGGSFTAGATSALALLLDAFCADFEKVNQPDA